MLSGHWQLSFSTSSSDWLRGRPPTGIRALSPPKDGEPILCEVAEGYDDKEYMRQTGYRSHIPQFAFAFSAKSLGEQIYNVELIF